MAIHVNPYLDITKIPRECVEDCTVGGQDASEPVAYWRKRLGLTVDAAKARKCLQGYGAWSKEKLAAMNDETLADKVLWLACGDFAEYAHAAAKARFNPWKDDRPADFDPSAGSDQFYLE